MSWIMQKPNEKLLNFLIILLWEVIYVRFYNWDYHLISYQLCMTWLNWSLNLYSRLRTISHLILTHNTQDFCSTNAYFICVIVQVQMWCVCAQPYVDQTKFFFFVLFVCFWKWFVSPMFFKVFQVVFVWKTCYLGVCVTHFMYKLNWELNGPNLKFFNFG